MSVMTRGIISQPFTLAMHSDYTRRQFYSHAQVLLAESDRLLKLLERTVEQHVPLTELEGVPGWSRVVELVDVVAERDQLRAEAHRLTMGMGMQVIKSFSEHADQKSIDELLAAGIQVDKEEISRLRAEVAGLRTGYEAYEQVNAELKAEVEKLRKERDACHPFKPFHEPSIGYTGCVICGMYTDHGGLPCPKTRATVYAALGQGEQS